MSLEMKFLNSTQGLNIRALAARTWYGVLKIVILSLALGLWLNLGSVWAAPNATLLQTSLRDRLGELQQQISGYRVELRQLKDRQKTLESEIKFAGLEINKITRQIEATEVAIGISNAQVEELVAQINETEVELSRQRGILGHFLIILNEQDRESVAEALLTEESFQDFFVKYQTLMSLQGRMLQSVDKVQELKKGLELKQTEAEDQRAEELQLRSIQQYQRASLQIKVGAKQQLIDQGEVRAQVLNNQEDSALEAVEQVRRHIYILQGLSGSLTLEAAYAMAAKVANRLNIRPALLMALIKKESDWGSNVGSGNWKRDMHPRDHAAFIEICKKLGLDPNAMPVSRKPAYGWGGAMGPAQFLPATWLSYEDEIAVVTGHNPPSPWVLEDAFAAAAIKLSKNGANARTWDAEWKAAQLYFAGGNWNKPQYSFYGDAIMELAEEIEAQIQTF